MALQLQAHDSDKGVQHVFAKEYGMHCNQYYGEIPFVSLHAYHPLLEHDRMSLIWKIQVLYWSG